MPQALGSVREWPVREERLSADRVASELVQTAARRVRAVQSFAAADSAHIRREAGDSKRDPGILCKPFANRLHALPSGEGRLNIGPQCSDLASFGDGLFRAASHQAGPSEHGPIDGIVWILSVRHRTPLNTK